MKTLRSLFPFAAMSFFAPDGLGLGSPGPAAPPAPAPARYTRKSDGAIVTAMQATSDDIATVPGVFVDPKTDANPSPAPYVVTQTGLHEPVYQGDYVITESDGQHYYTYPPEKFDAEYSATPLDTSSPADLPQGTDAAPAAFQTAAAADPVQQALVTNTLYAQPEKAGDPLVPLGTVAGSQPLVINAGGVPSPFAPNVPTAEAIEAAKQEPVGVNPGIHMPASPDAPTAHEAMHALSTLLEFLPKQAAGLVENAKVAAAATHFTAEMKTKILAAAAVVEQRFKFA